MDMRRAMACMSSHRFMPKTGAHFLARCLMEDTTVRLKALTGTIVTLLAGVMLMAAPASAQFSKSYKFLDAVKKKDGESVSEQLAEPGTTIVNTHDITNGETALHIVTERRDVTWITFLISKGADTNARNSKGETPLEIASNLGFAEGARVLVANGARVDEPSSTGETPLIAAVHRRDMAMIRLLLAGGANADRSDNSGRSARDYAAFDGKDSPMVALINELAKTQRKPVSNYGPTF